jgi:nicotinamidase-related amidase
VLFTASDGYLRDLEIIVPSDCSAAASVEHHERGLEHMSRVLHAQTTPSAEIDFMELLASSPDAAPHAATSPG